MFDPMIQPKFQTNLQLIFNSIKTFSILHPVHAYFLRYDGIRKEKKAIAWPLIRVQVIDYKLWVQKFTTKEFVSTYRRNMCIFKREILTQRGCKTDF